MADACGCGRPNGDPRPKKGRRRYTGAWREPKVLIVYVVDAEGKRDASFVPVMDATLKGPDAVFALLRTYLQRLEITQADQVLFVADGAPWIWKRVPLLVQALGLAAEQVHELLDFYHAVQHLGQVAALRKDWSAKARARWRTQQRRLLLQGQVEQVIAAVQAHLSRPQQQGDPHAAGLLHQEPESHGVCQAPGHEASDRERSNRKYRAACGQSALERPESLLVSRQCRGHTPVAVVLQSGSVEHVETYGYFTPCSAGSLTGKMGTRPSVHSAPNLSRIRR